MVQELQHFCSTKFLVRYRDLDIGRPTIILCWRPESKCYQTLFIARKSDEQLKKYRLCTQLYRQHTVKCYRQDEMLLLVATATLIRTRNIVKNMDTHVAYNFDQSQQIDGANRLRGNGQARTHTDAKPENCSYHWTLTTPTNMAPRKN